MVQITLKPNCLARKPKTTFGTIPEFTIAGKGTINQSNAALRYVGRETGLYPSDAWDARVDQVLDAIDDLSAKIGPTLYEKDEAKKKEAREALVAGPIPFYLGAFEKLHKENKDGKYIVGSKLTIADLKLAFLLRWLASGTLDHISADIIKPYDGLNALKKAVEEHDKVKEYYANRKK